MTPRTILVPLDGSLFAEWALPAAISIARRSGARLELICVHVPLDTMVPRNALGYQVGWAADVETRALEYLTSVMVRISRVADIDVSKAVRSGIAVDALLEHADAVNADLIAMTPHGWGPLRRAWLGSVAGGLVRKSSIPVLLLRPGEEIEPDLAHAVPFRTVILPLDGSGFSEEVLPAATALGELAGATYVLVQVVPPASTLHTVIARDVAFPHAWVDADVASALHASAHTHLDGVATRLRKRELQVETEVLVEPSAAAAILDFAERRSADLIAMTTHGRSGIGRLVLGSVADKVLRDARIPVLLYRPRGS
jgi:nucleotide-binding universal stress UspA family protein